jgi:hypothetical protein
LTPFSTAKGFYVGTGLDHRFGGGTWPKGKLAEIALKQIKEGEIVELPDLLINQEMQE